MKNLYSNYSNQSSNDATEQFEIDASRFDEQEIESSYDEGLLNTTNALNHILNTIDLNIQAFANDSWCSKNNVLKMLVDRAHCDKTIFTIRLFNQCVFRCGVKTPTVADKIMYLKLMKERIKQGFLDDAIKECCAKRVDAKNVAKQKKREKRKAEREALKAFERELKLQVVLGENKNNPQDWLKELIASGKTPGKIQKYLKEVIASGKNPNKVQDWLKELIVSGKDPSKVQDWLKEWIASEKDHK